MTTPPPEAAPTALAQLPAAGATAAETVADAAAFAPVPNEVAPWRRMLGRPLESLLARQLTQPMTFVQQDNLRNFWQDGIWASTSEAFALTFIPLFALALGASAGEIGIMAAVGNLFAAIAFIPGARLLEHVGKRMPIVLWSVGTTYRGLLLVMVAMPFFITSPALAIPLVIAIGAVRAFGLNLADPSMTSLAADLVPPFMRGRYFSLRNFLMGVATLVVTPMAGIVISAGAWLTGNPLSGYQIAFLLAFVTGMLATLAYSRIKEPPFRPAGATIAAKGQSYWQIMRSSRALSAFIIFAFIWNLSLQIAGPYFNIYLVTHLGGTATSVGIVSAASAFAGLFGQIFFGRLTDRKGSVWVFLTTGFSIVAMPVVWVFYTAPWQVGINNLFAGFLWAGFLLANFNLLLLLTPDEQRPRAAALYQTAVFTGAIIGPLIGGYLADNVGYSLVFILSGVGRLVAISAFALLGARVAFAHERKAFAVEA